MLHTRIVAHPVHGKCLFADDGVVEIGVSLSFGLRVVHFSFVGEENVFFEQPQNMKTFTTEAGWRIRGGHRLWLAPESPADYYPDNEPVTCEVRGDVVRVTQNEDPLLHVVKCFEIRLQKNAVKITHRVTNTGTRRKAALWALSVLAGGGVLTVPLPRREGGYDPLLHVAAWDYTDLGDERLTFDKQKITICQRKGKNNLKIGVGHPAGAVTYENGETVFKKHVPLEPGKPYPDGGVSFEVFVSGHMTEIEGLSPLKTLLPGRSSVYREIWELCRKGDGRKA